MEHMHDAFAWEVPEKLPYSVNWFFVLLSAAVAILGSFTALSFAESLVTQQLQLKSQHATNVVRILAAAVFSIGVNTVWAMHFIATSAVSYGQPHRYELGQTVLSLIYILAGTALGFMVFLGHSEGLLSRDAVKQQTNKFIQLYYQKPHDSDGAAAHVLHLWQQFKAALGWRLVLGGTLIGTGVFAMHHVGMGASRIRARIVWHPVWIGLSPVVAIVAGSVLLFLVFTAHGVKRRLIASIVLGLAVNLVHYYGYASATFVPVSSEDWAEMSASWAGEVVIDAKVAVVVTLLLSSIVRFALVGLIATALD